MATREDEAAGGKSVELGQEIADEPTTEREARAAWRKGCRSPLEAAGSTHPGRLRAKNEDAFEIVAEVGLAMVADGLGGHPAGDIASRMAVQEVSEHMREMDPDPTLPDARDVDALPLSTMEFFRLAVQRANRAIHFAGHRFPVCAGMGTTFAALLVVRGFAIFAHVGDSRIYRLRGGHLTQLTEDHSMAAEYIRACGAEADPEIAKQYESTLSRCLGAWPEVAVSVSAERRVPGDTYLLCTDGLWTVVPHDKLAKIVAEDGDLAEIADRLIDEANEAGGPDNITALVVRPLAEGSDAPAPS